MIAAYTTSKALCEIKQKKGKMPTVIANMIKNKIDQTTELLDEIDDFQSQPLNGKIRRKILTYNKKILLSRSSQMNPFQKNTHQMWYS